jgi:hypothetical protein
MKAILRDGSDNIQIYYACMGHAIFNQWKTNYEYTISAGRGYFARSSDG